MSKYFYILLLTFATIAKGQPPSIDSMRVDEEKNRLVLYGDFGIAKGGVWCDSVELEIIDWSDSLIFASIPASGKGSAGIVIVGGRGYKGEGRKLTSWGMGANYGIYHGGNTSSEYVHEEWTLQWRCDMESRLRNLNKGFGSVIPISIRETENYTYHFDWYDPSNPIDQRIIDKEHSAKGFTTALFDITGLIVHFDIRELVSSDGSMLTYNEVLFNTILDTSLLPQSGSSRDFYWPNENILKKSVLFSPTSATLELRFQPTLSKPDSGSIALVTDGTILSWNSLRAFTKYHLEVFKDTALSNKFIDTLVSSTDFKLPSLRKSTKYFWRVAAVNDEGESIWSNIWTFETGLKADVEVTSPSDKTLICYPNPASRQLHILCSNPLPGNATIILSDLKGNVLRDDPFEVGIYDTSWDISLIPNGIYLLCLRSNNHSTTKLITIFR